MARKTLDPTQTLRCDILIDRQLNPELFDAVVKITGARNRASFVRNCAEKYLVMPKGQQLMQANGVAFQSHAGNPPISSPPLSSGPLESHARTTPRLRDAAKSAHPGSDEPPTERVEATTKRIQAPANVMLSTSSPVSHKRAGSAALAGMLSNATPGLS